MSFAYAVDATIRFIESQVDELFPVYNYPFASLPMMRTSIACFISAYSEPSRLRERLQARLPAQASQIASEKRLPWYGPQQSFYRSSQFNITPHIIMCTMINEESFHG